MRTGLKIFLISFVVLGNSCLTVRQIERNCDQFAKICITSESETIIIHDTTWIERRDTIVQVELKRDTVFKTIPVRSNGTYISSDTSYLWTGLARSEAFIWRSQLFHTLESGDTILNIRLNNAITERNRLREELSEKVRTVEVRRDTQFGKFAKKWFLGTVIIIIIGVVLLFFKIRSRIL